MRKRRWTNEGRTCRRTNFIKCCHHRQHRRHHNRRCHIMSTTTQSWSSMSEIITKPPLVGLTVNKVKVVKAPSTLIRKCENRPRKMGANDNNSRLLIVFLEGTSNTLLLLACVIVSETKSQFNKPPPSFIPTAQKVTTSMRARSSPQVIILLLLLFVKNINVVDAFITSPQRQVPFAVADRSRRLPVSKIIPLEMKKKDNASDADASSPESGANGSYRSLFFL